MRTLRGVTVLLLVALAGCTSPPASSNPAQRETDIRAVTQELTNCVRANGVPNFPDPTYDEHGMPNAGQDWDPANNPQVRAAMEGPCRSILERLQDLAREPAEQRTPLSADELAKVRQYAECMRAHGLPDFPDGDNTGRFVLPSTWPEGIGKGNRPEDQVLLEAMKACEQFAVPGMAF